MPAHPVIEYSNGLHRAHDQARRYRRVGPVVPLPSVILAVAVGLVGPVRLALRPWLSVAIIVGGTIVMAPGNGTTWHRMLGGGDAGAATVDWWLP